MEELFGVSMDVIMVVLAAIFVPSVLLIAVLGWRNRIMLKMGLRNIPRRRAQTVLLIIGIMLSTVIISAAFGTGDTISHSIRSNATKTLGAIDEVIVSARATSEDNFGTGPYVPYERFERLQVELAGVTEIDGMSPGIGETVPAELLRTSLSEGQMRIAGVDPSTLSGFGSFHSTAGEKVRLEDLKADEAYINHKAAEEMDAVAGDEIRAFVGGDALSFQVRAVIDGGGLAGNTSTLVIPLARAQAIFGRAGHINSIVISNRGDEHSGADLSEEVTRKLRALFADAEVAAQLKVLLSQDDVLEALEEGQTSVAGALRADMSTLMEELGRDGVSEVLISLMADEQISSRVLAALDKGGLQNSAAEAHTLFAGLGEFRVFDVKQQVLDEADEAGSEVTSFFIVMGLFSIMVGILLIFLIFVMLAAARRSEMGMARAIGARRSHLVQMYVFEGTAYAIVSAAVGVALGLALSALIVVIVNRIFAGGGGGVPEDFQMVRHFEVRSIVVSYCLGMVITLATIAISAYRVSRLNIVAAVRGLPVPITVSDRGWLEILAVSWGALLRPFRLIGRGALIMAITAAAVLPLVVTWSIFQILWRPFRQGWLAFLLGLLMTWSGVASDEAAPLRIGVSLMIIGIGLMMRTAARWSSLRPDAADRVAYTTMGVLMLGFWVVPIGTIRGITGDLNAGIEMFFVSGISMVAAAVWTVMYNADLILRALTFFTGRIGRMRPVLVTAVAYPMSAKFRTGLTLAMFALVMFTLIVMSILTSAFGESRDVDVVTGGWDIEANLNRTTPIQDIHHAIEESPDLHAEDFEAIGGYTFILVEARQLGAESQGWEWYGVRAADDDFLEASSYTLRLIADGYGTTGKEVFEALKNDPTLAVVDAPVVPTRSRFGDDIIPFELEGIYYEDDKMSPIDIEVLEPSTGAIVPLKVIGVLDQLSDSFGNLLGYGMFTSRGHIDGAIPSHVPITTYRFRLHEGVDEERLAKNLEASFRDHGMETEVLEERIAEIASADRAFHHLFTGFMGLGLMVGIAALGVISLRAVVERRQQIGVLRALGWRKRMVQLSFLLESSFVALLGIGIGVALGTVLSYLIVSDIRENEGLSSLRFSFPWLQIIVIVGVAYLFSLVTTWLPARQASRIYPAEALRYE